MPTKTNLILFVAMTLSTGLITAMEESNHQVTVYNDLVTSEIIFSFPSLSLNRGRSEAKDPCNETTIARENHVTFLIPTRHKNIKSIPCKISLPYCYKPSSFEIEINQDKEVIHVSSRASQEEWITISKNHHELIKINSLMLPGTYLHAKELVMKELESQK